MFLVRHGESVANVNPAILTELSDHIIPLSAEGRTQAQEAGKFLAEQLNEESKARIHVSPYKRARDTAELIVGAGGPFLDLQENIFLGEQQFGLFEGLSLDEIRSTFPSENAHFEKSIAFGGRFYARMPLGESRFDVVSRVCRVIDQIMQDEHYWGIRDVVVVAHGITARAFAMAWLDRTPEWMEAQPNPLNCSIRLLDGSTDRGYIFPGFQRSSHAARGDKEQDLVAAVSEHKLPMTTPPPISREALERRLTALQEELTAIRSQLDNYNQ